MKHTSSALFICLAALALCSCEDTPSGTVMPIHLASDTCTYNGMCISGVCDLATGQCVECLRNEDCLNPATPLCRTDINQCVQCLSTDDCSAGFCNTTSNKCGECASHADCTDPDKPVCNAAAMKCEPCTQNSSNELLCSEVNPDTPVCILSGPHQGRCGECMEPDDCASGVCVLNVCKDCDSSHPCADPNTFCENIGLNANLCVSCNDKVTCPAGLVCTPNGGCVQCFENMHCYHEDAPVCDVTRNVCVPCTAETQALTCTKDRPVCDETIFQCVTCLPSDANSGNDTCLAIDPEKPFCLADPDNSLNNTCITCNSTTDGGQCIADPSAPICRIDEATGAGACTPCTNSEQCRAKDNTPDLCDTKTGACVECLQVSDCAGGMLFCEQGQCMNCRSNDDCQSGQCLNGLCYECASDAECTTPERPICVLDSNSRLDHLCVECDPAGTPQAQADQCGGQLCNEITGKCDPCTTDTEPTAPNSGLI